MMSETISTDVALLCLRCNRVYYNDRSCKPQCPFCQSVECREATEDEETESEYTF